MKFDTKKLYLVPVLGLIVILSSCEKTADPTNVAIYGCTDKQAINYSSRATVDDKSCYYVNTTQATCIPVIEIYTGVRSKYGPDAMNLAKSIQNNNPGTVVIAIHTGPDAVGKTGWPDYTTAFGQKIADTAGMIQPTTMYPAGSVNRYHYADVPSVIPQKMVAGSAYTVLYKAGFLPASSYWMTKMSSVNIGIASYWTESLRKLKVLVEYYYLTAEPDENYLNVALLESGIVGKQVTVNTTTGQDTTLLDYSQQYVLRTLITGQWGELISTTVGTKIKKTYEYTVPATVNIDNCYVAAFISRQSGNDRREIITGKQKKAKNL